MFHNLSIFEDAFIISTYSDSGKEERGPGIWLKKKQRKQYSAHSLALSIYLHLSACILIYTVRRIYVNL